MYEEIATNAISGGYNKTEGVEHLFAQADTESAQMTHNAASTARRTVELFLFNTHIFFIIFLHVIP